VKGSPGEPPARGETVRKSLIQTLRNGRYSAHDLSAEVSIPEKDVVAHLEHLRRSLAHGNERLVIEPPRCAACEFVFKKRERLAAPSRCPRCRSERIESPLFSIESD
jgi:transcriptional regulator